MRFNIGMYGGSFDPPHLGHFHNIIEAAAMCKTLFVIISYSIARDYVNKDLRYRWLLNSFKHLSNVKIILVEDTAPSKDGYDKKHWKAGAKTIKALIKHPINVVFCGDDYLGSNTFEELYQPISEIFYFPRNEVPISSSQIRSNPFKYWDYLPNICRSYFIKKILILGGESTGKSTLVQNLALAYNTNYVSEVGRDTCAYAGGEDFMVADDLYENFLRQKLNIIDATKYSNKILFVDTDEITTLFYSTLLLKDSLEIERCEKLAYAINNLSDWNLVFFLEPTVDFIQDGTRNEVIASDREKYSIQIKILLNQIGVPYVCIDGDYVNRFNTVKSIIEQKMGHNSL